MINIEAKILFLTYKRIFFAETVPDKHFFEFISLRQYKGTPPENWLERKFKTLFINLNEQEDVLFNNIEKGTRYEIKRAERDGVTTGEDSIKNFQEFFNSFAPSKGLKKLSNQNINSYKPFTIITKAEFNNQVLAMHAHIIYKDDSRARLLYSATVNRQTTDINLNLVGRANRFLHWQDILKFKSIGLQIYDWGGIADNPNDEETSGIDLFKSKFGGYIVNENHYEDSKLSKIKKLLGR